MMLTSFEPSTIFIFELLCFERASREDTDGIRPQLFPLNGRTKRTIFHTNSPPIHSGVRLSVLRKPCLLYTTLNSVLAKHSESVKTVQVSGCFGKLRSAKAPPVEVRLNTGSGVKVGVPQNSRRYLPNEQVILYSILD